MLISTALLTAPIEEFMWNDMRLLYRKQGTFAHTRRLLGFGVWSSRSFRPIEPGLRKSLTLENGNLVVYFNNGKRFGIKVYLVKTICFSLLTQPNLKGRTLLL